MKYQRGFIFPWSLLLKPTVLLGIALAAASAFGYLQTTRLGAAQDRIQALRGEYAERDRQAQEDATKAVQAAQDRARAAERKSVEDVAAVSAKFEKEKANVAARNKKVIADLHTGNLILRVQLDTRGSESGNRDSTAETGSGPCLSDGGSGTAVLGQADSAFLIGEASAADEVVVQLTACQEVVRKDRE